MAEWKGARKRMVMRETFLPGDVMRCKAFIGGDEAPGYLDAYRTCRKNFKKHHPKG